MMKKHEFPIVGALYWSIYGEVLRECVDYDIYTKKGIFKLRKIISTDYGFSDLAFETLDVFRSSYTLFDEKTKKYKAFIYFIKHKGTGYIRAVTDEYWAKSKASATHVLLYAEEVIYEEYITQTVDVKEVEL